MTSYRVRLALLASDSRDMLHPDWQEHQDGLTRTFAFPNLRACAAFVEALMTAANAVNHHPDVVTDNGGVTVTFVTHSAGDTVTEKDYAGAREADRLALDAATHLSVNLGDTPGHPFRGNQWSDGGGSDAPARSHRAIVDKMAALKEKYPVVAKNYPRHSGTEMGSIEKHTGDVAREWSRQLPKDELDAISERFGSDIDKLMTTAIPLHDIGKADAIEAGDKKKQHEHTVPILQEVLRQEGFKATDVRLATELVNHDLLGPLAHGDQSREAHAKVATALREKAAKVGMAPKDFFKLQVAFFQADASAYPYITQFMEKREGKWTFEHDQLKPLLDAMDDKTSLSTAGGRDDWQSVLARYATVQNADGVRAVRAPDLFERPAMLIRLPLNRKTTANARAMVPVSALVPSQTTVPVPGLAAYAVRPRRDPPDVAHLVGRDGRERWVIQEGHTRTGAAKLRGDTEVDARVWEFTEDAHGGWTPVPRGLHRHPTPSRGERGHFAPHAVSLGDVPGHEFHGNQHTDGGGSVPHDTTVHGAGKSVQLPGRYDKTKIPKDALAVTSKNGYIIVVKSGNDPDYMWVHHIRVADKAQGKGEGTALYKTALKAAQAKGFKGILKGNLPGRDISTDAHRMWDKFERQGLTEKITVSVRNPTTDKDEPYESTILVRAEPKQSLSYAWSFGDLPGHPFRGNQWSDGRTEKAPDTSGGKGGTLRSPHADAPRVFNTPDEVMEETSWGETRWVWKNEQGEPSGRLLTGKVIPHADLPPELYHVTTNTPAVLGSGVLLGQRGDAGLGGGQADGVSFTTSKEDARVIQRELVRSVRIARGDDGIDAITQYARDDEKEAGLPPGTLDKAAAYAREGYDANKFITQKTFRDGHWHDEVPPDRERKERSIVKDALNAYLQIRGNEKVAILKNPILFGDQEKLKHINPEHVQTLTVPAKNIPEKALVTSGSDAFLKEVRVYADVPSVKTTAQRLSLHRERLALLQLGDSPGHPFRGNQHTDGEGVTPAPVLPKAHSIRSEVTDSYSGQTNVTTAIRNADGKRVAYADYVIYGERHDALDRKRNQHAPRDRDTVFRDEITISMIHVDPDERRKGLGMALLRQIAHEHPGMRINSGMRTDEGGKLWAKWEQRPERLPLSYREKLALLLGDFPGHPFRGNQWSDSLTHKAPDSKGSGSSDFKVPQPEKTSQRLVISESQREGFRAPKLEDADRVKALRVPPGWTKVQLSEDPKAELQATGVNVKGRTQYLYSAEHSQHASAEKFARARDFRAALPGIRRAVADDLHAKDPETRTAASVLYLIEKTGFRVGSDRDTHGDVQAHGATTLQGQHVEVNGDDVRFRFTAKKGVPVDKTVTDKRLARIITQRKKKAGDDGRLFDTTDGAVRGYLGRVAKGFSPKDFRTHQGTALALAEIKSRPAPKSEREFKKAQREVAKVVAAHLGNTPAVSLKSYVDPAVWGRWQRGAKGSKRPPRRLSAVPVAWRNVAVQGGVTLFQ